MGLTQADVDDITLNWCGQVDANGTVPGTDPNIPMLLRRYATMAEAGVQIERHNAWAWLVTECSLSFIEFH